MAAAKIWCFSVRGHALLSSKPTPGLNVRAAPDWSESCDSAVLGRQRAAQDGCVVSVGCISPAAADDLSYASIPALFFVVVKTSLK